MLYYLKCSRGDNVANYVFRDEERKNVLYANNVNKEDKSTRFYCPNPICEAYMFICGIDGSSSAYFRATHKEHGHIEGCSFRVSNNFNSERHDETSFDFEKAMQALLEPTKQIKKSKKTNLHKAGTPNKTVLRTIRQIYDMCKAHKCSDTYNGLQIGRMLLDDRSLYMYPKGIFGYKLIEAKVSGYFYDTNNQTITLCTPRKDEKYKLLLKFSDKELFLKMREKLFNNRDKIVLVSGNWLQSELSNTFITSINSKRQYHIIMK